MAGSVIKIEGLEKTLARFDVKKYEPQIQKVFNEFGKNVEKTAKKLAPKDESNLVLNIFSDVAPLGAVIGSKAEYSSYVEFGTRKYAARYISALPATWQQLAAKSKGKGRSGTFDQFVQNIFAWVRRKGIGAIKTKSGKTSTSKSSLEAMQSAAYAIALNILQNGSKPHPFLYPAVNDNTKKLIDDLKAIKL